MSDSWTETRWYVTKDNLTEFGSVLIEIGFTAEQLQAYYEKPWKWDRERGWWVFGGVDHMKEQMENNA